jgi:hypothetical protein
MRQAGHRKDDDDIWFISLLAPGTCRQGAGKQHRKNSQRQNQNNWMEMRLLYHDLDCTTSNKEDGILAIL